MKRLLAVLLGLGLLIGVMLFGNSEKEARGSDEQIRAGEESLFAEVDRKGDVLRVIVADAEAINSGFFGDSENFVRVYADGGKRHNYPGLGHTYDKNNDAFIPPKPHESWRLNENFEWEAPVKKPKDGKEHTWDEGTKKWKEETR